jgi:hypothetical protein
MTRDISEIDVVIRIFSNDDIIAVSADLGRRARCHRDLERGNRHILIREDMLLELARDLDLSPEGSPSANFFFKVLEDLEALREEIDDKIHLLIECIS